jgi:hypothetical protein
LLLLFVLLDQLRALGEPLQPSREHFQRVAPLQLELVHGSLELLDVFL